MRTISALGVLGTATLLINLNLGHLEARANGRVTAVRPLQPSADLTTEINQLRSKVKYVFVLYQENRSFDSYFGTFPGADGLYSQSPAGTPGFTQPITNTDGTVGTIQPFRIGPAQYAADTDDIDHSHPLIVAKMDVNGGQPQMDRFAQVEEAKYLALSSKYTALQAKQMGELAMAYEDCDIVPLLWNYANKFTLFDHIFQDMTGPSTPGNLSIIAAQTGITQYILHPSDAYTGNGAGGPGVPVLNDADPFWGSQLDTTTNKMPVNPGDFTNGKEYSTQMNLTFASLPLTLAGSSLPSVVKADTQPSTDLVDVQHDITAIGAAQQQAVPWGWYEEGYDREPTDPNAGPATANGTHASYITHHNGPQYFGYIANNTNMRSDLHGLDDLMVALDKHTLPSQGGVFYVKGGYENIMGLKPSDPDPKVQKNFLGDDDHPAYSDSQISEAMLAQVINDIASGPYWSQSAIIITWDDSEGDYDHVPPPVLKAGPDNQLTGLGPRVPLLVISPYARTHSISHEQGSQSSVVKFVDTLFNLIPLGELPDELNARQMGATSNGLANAGPLDAITPGIGNLLSAFDPARLAGRAAPLPPSYVEVPQNWISTLPQQNGLGCAAIGIVPTDEELGITNHIPADFNPRPLTNPTAS